MNKISKRDVKFFLLGIFTLFLIESIWDWQGTISAMKRGYHDGYNSAPN